MRALLFNKTLTKVLVEYSDYSNIFSIEKIAKLLKNVKINKYIIELEEDLQLSFKLFYNLKLVELETVKIYIETNLAKYFI